MNEKTIEQGANEVVTEYYGISLEKNGEDDNALSAGTQTAWLRVNQAGYTPEREKIAVVLSDADISGEAWCLKKGADAVLEGQLSSAAMGDDFHVAQAFYYKIDFSAVKEKGAYTLNLAGVPAQPVIISEYPYSLFATQALMHLRAMRSGGQTLLTQPSHLGDGAAIAHCVDGDWRQGAWKEATPRRTIDMRGGHYDAGDLIKFTLTEASLAWHLLVAYEKNPAMFTIVHSTSGLPDILDEAKYSLDYLAKTFPDTDTFVIQVGDSKDHAQGWRLPENDKLDGKRPALCALSRVHMGSTAAALALGAYVFRALEPDTAALYESKAISIYARAREEDTQASAFERNVTNDFYFDLTDADNMALAAAELYKLTQNRRYLDDGNTYAPPAASCVTWKSLNGLANYRLAEQGDAGAKDRLFKEVSCYNYDNVWSLPLGGYCWGVLPIWIGMANIHLLTQLLDGNRSLTTPFLGVLDYTFGRNNWGISMLASPDLPHSIRNIYSFIWHILGKLPVGALSLGPGDRKTHDELKKYFRIPENSAFEAFNTSEAVFYDNAFDFMIQESAIWGQGNIVLMLALASQQ